jgi:biopolymer transport protein ExbB
MMRFDPTGMFARSLAECLAVQLAEKNRLDPAMQALLDNLEMLARRDMRGLMAVCGVDAEDMTDMVAELRGHSPLGRRLAAGLRQAGAPRDVMKESIEDEGRIVAHELERYLTTLGTIAAMSPLLGLLGTVIGMIEIFGSQSPTGTDPRVLAHGISVALYNTAFGLVVAIPSMIFYRHFRARVDDFLVEMEAQAVRLVEAIHGDRHGD